MAPLITLLITFTISLLWLKARGYRDPGIRSARIALGAMLVLTGTAHFASTEAMVQMLPPVLPFPLVLVYATGILELLAAVLLFQRLARPSPWLGWAIAVFFVALLPANIYSAVAEVGLGGHGPSYLWFRVPLQMLFIGWALVATGAVQRSHPVVAVA